MRRIAALLLLTGCVVHLPARTQYAPPPYAPPSGNEPAYFAAPAPEPARASPLATPAAPQTFWFACAHATPEGGYCPILVAHEHPYPPETSAANDDCAGVADGFRYEGAHPTSGGGWCEISLLHLHDFAPLAGLAWASRTPGVYVYEGPPRGAAVAPATQPGPIAVEPAGSEGVRKAVKVFKAIGRVGEAVGKGAATFVKDVNDRSVADEGNHYKREKSKSTHHSGGHHGGGHRGGHH